MNASVREPAEAVRTRWFVVWMALLACALIGFVALGNWQVRRLHWKLALIHDVDVRVHAPPVPAPGPTRWSHIRSARLHYLHVRLEGRYLEGKQTLVHGGSAEGYGYWVMTPMRTTRGFIVLVNRGFVPDGANRPRPAPPGVHELTGLLRYSEPGGGFMRANRPHAGQWYSRDVAAIAGAEGLPADQVAPYFVDVDADPEASGYPLAGLTKIHFRNAHLGYAVTWYLLALGCLLAAGIVIRHRLRARRMPAA